jgi:RNA polymerase sigma-70 factor (ECF subfamily)
MRVSNSYSDKSDDELIRLYKSEYDLEILGELYKRYTGLVFGVCLKYLKDREASRDAVMQIFEKLIKSLLEHEITHFKSWLYVTARNHVLMQLRKRKDIPLEDIPQSFMESETVMHQEDALESNLTKLEKCIETLIEEQKACVTLFYLQHRCYQEITELTGYELKKVKSYIQNGKRNLKICMDQNG